MPLPWCSVVVSLSMWSPNINLLAALQIFMPEDTDSSRTPGLISGFNWIMNVQCWTMFLVSQLDNASFLLYFPLKQFSLLFSPHAHLCTVTYNRRWLWVWRKLKSTNKPCSNWQIRSHWDRGKMSIPATNSPRLDGYPSGMARGSSLFPPYSNQPIPKLIYKQ